MPRRVRVQIDLAPYPSAVITAAAAAQGVSQNTLAKSLLESSLLSLTVQIDAQAQAEGCLMTWVEQTVSRYRISDAWDEHITLEIFDRIRDEMGATYQAAIAGGNVTRINRSISRQIRKHLGDVTRHSNGAIRYVQLPRGAHLIGAYTCLYRGSPGPSRAMRPQNW